MQVVLLQQLIYNEEALTDPGNSFEPVRSVCESDVCVVPGSNLESQSSSTPKLIPETN